MAPQSPINTRSRGGRRLRPTRRAIESDVQITGITSPLDRSSLLVPAPSTSPPPPPHSSTIFSGPSAAMEQQPDASPRCRLGKSSDAVAAAAAAVARAESNAADVAAESAAEGDEDLAPTAATPAPASSGRASTAQTPEPPRKSVRRPQKQAVKRGLQPQHPYTSTQTTEAPSRSANPPKKYRKTSASTRPARKEAQPQRKKVRPQTPAKPKPKPTFATIDPELQPHRLPVYPWEYPRPTDFLNLPESRKAWKASADEAQGEVDTDPELDDWHEFSAIPSDIVTDLPVKTSIGLNFVSRAKRAFRAGRSWTDFEQEELAIDSMAGLRAIKDRRERAIAEEYALDNDVRLHVFEQIKVRLCHEIWLEEYPEQDETTDADELLSKRDSVMNTGTASPSSSYYPKTDCSGIATTSTRFGGSLPADTSPEKQRRTQPDLPGKYRELYQPQGPRVRATQTNMSRLAQTEEELLAAIELGMKTSSEEE
ncbi:hypothetical protein Q7P37_011400 [Cladosporium fusiforme]